MASETTFHSPLDATLSPDGKVAYFIAIEGDEAAIYKADAPSTGAPVKLAGGDPLVSPFGIDVSTDGATLVVADPGAQQDPEVEERGALFSLSRSGGTLSLIAGTAGYQPRGVVVQQENGADVAYFSGKEKDTRAPGVFKVPVAGGSVTAVAKGSAFVDPSGLAVAKDGTTYVVDTGDPERATARLLKVSGGTTSLLLGDIAVGYPAGAALSQDEKTVLLSARDVMARTDAVLRVTVATGAVEQVSGGIDAFEEPAGLHRAKNADTYIWADSSANNGGTVYVINKQP